jgi:hypothetical protein
MTKPAECVDVEQFLRIDDLLANATDSLAAMYFIRNPSITYASTNGQFWGFGEHLPRIADHTARNTSWIHLPWRNQTESPHPYKCLMMAMAFLDSTSRFLLRASNFNVR